MSSEPFVHDLTIEQATALSVAKELARAGVPIFVAEPDPAGKGHNGTGFWLPAGWERTVADPAIADTWRPGMALCAVMGCGLDLLDFDLRNGASVASLNGSTPTSYGVAATPSGGAHSFIKSLHVGSRDNIFPGIDVKGGLPDGSSRGFAFLAPTVRKSKATGEMVAYRWVETPDLARLAQAAEEQSGAILAALIREVRSGGVRKVDGPGWWRKFVTDDEPQSEKAARNAIKVKLTAVREWTVSSGAGFRLILLAAAFTLGGYVGGGYLEEDEAREQLRAAVREVWTDTNEDDELWIDQGLADGQIQPFYVYTEEQAQQVLAQQVAPASEPPVGETPNAGSAFPPAPPSPPRLDDEPLSEPFDPYDASSDQEIAESVAVYVQPLVRLAIDTGQWVVNEGERWTAYGDRASWVVSTVAKKMPPGIKPVPKELDQRTVEHWQAERKARFEDSTRSGKIERKLKAVMQNRYLGGVLLGKLDSNPELLWAGGIAWDLRASIDAPVAAHIPLNTPHLHTARCRPELIPTPHWDAFLGAVWPDETIRRWALRVLSIAMTGYADAALPVLYGEERNGKTSIITLLMDALGTYGISADPKLLAGTDNAHSSIIYALKGVRLAFVDEGPRRGHLAQERLKQLTGGGQLTGNAMRKDPVTFSATHTLIMTSNDEPPVTDPALRARIRAVYCAGNRAEVRARRKELTPAVWAQEVPGVLAQMMREAAAWLADPETAQNETAPAVLRGAVDEMVASQDPVRHWRENCTVPADPGSPGQELYDAFADWHQRSPIYRKTAIPTLTAFGRSLTDQGFPSHKVHGKWYRSLSVLGGPAGIAPWEPLPTAHMTPGYGGLTEGGGGSVAGPEPKLANSETGRSDPISSSLLAGLAGYNTTTTDNKQGSTTASPIRSNEKTYTDGNGDLVAKPAEKPATQASDQAKEGWRDDPPRTRPNSPEPATTPAAEDDLSSASESPESSPSVTADSESPLDPQRTEIAKRADEAKISKAEARATLKAEQIAEAIREASGEILSLPAVVDRAGHVIPVTDEQAAAVVRSCLERTDGALTVDVETSGYPVGHKEHKLRSVQLGDEVAAVVFDPIAHADAIRTLLSEATRLHAHSATADLVPLSEAGLIEMESGWERMFDTVTPAKLGDPASTGSDPGLKKLAEAVLGSHATAPAADEARLAVFKAGRWSTGQQKFVAQLTTPLERNGWAQINTASEVMLRYAASDVLDTAALAKRLPPVDSAVLERERIAEHMCARVTHRGLRIDADKVAELIEHHTRMRAERGAEVRELGIDNPGSSQQVAKKLAEMGVSLPKTPTGGLSATKDVLETLAASESDSDVPKFAQGVLDYRHSNTALGLFLTVAHEQCANGDGRARPTIYTLSTNTGRFSSVRPNAQQLSKEGGIRSIYVADEGMRFISADFSGVEIRGAAALSQDRLLLDVIAQGRDLHAEVALQAFGPDDEESTRVGHLVPRKADRYIAKRAVFGYIYGGSVPTLAKQTGVSESAMAAIVDSLKEMTPQLTAWSEATVRGVRRGMTQFRSYSGRVIHLPQQRVHAAPNYCIQGSCRELLVDALIRWRDTRWGTCTLVPIHDELLVQVPVEDAHDAMCELVKCMAGNLYGVEIKADPGKPDEGSVEEGTARWHGSTFWEDSV